MHRKYPTVIIVIDGFDPAYLEHGFASGTLPTMKSLKKCGFVGMADRSIPSTTNTNNTSIVTGVPPVHGITATRKCAAYQSRRQTAST